MTKNNDFLKKMMACLVAGMMTIALLLVFGNSGTLKWFPPAVVFSLVAITFITALIYPFLWQHKEKQQKINSIKVYGFLYAMIRYTIAFNLASFGWKKLLGLQFIVPTSISDKPMNQQSGEWLTWFYFAHSFTFGIIIALIQIVGSYFLLFQRTVLAAAMALFAFMLNLTLINIFYQMNAGALTQSILLTTGIAFLIFADFKRLAAFFFTATQAIPSISIKNLLAKNIIRLSTIILSLLFVLYLKSL